MGYTLSMKTINAITNKGEKFYYQLKSELEEKYLPSDYVTIEIESGRYFVGKTAIEAIEKAEKSSPDKQFFLARISEVAFKWYTLQHKKHE